MLHSRTTIALVATLLFAVGPLSVRAADVLDHVPGDALGIVVVKNLAAADAKIEKLLQDSQLQLPGPLALLKATTGIREGLDLNGDLLFAVLPSARPTEPMHFGIWLPVADYRTLITSLNGTPTDGITAVTVAGEDLLIVEYSQWAVIMDPDQRERLQAIRAAMPEPQAQIGRWKNWADANDVTAMLLPNGWQALLGWAAMKNSDGIAAVPAPADQAVDDLFGPPEEEADRGVDPAGAIGNPMADVLTQLRQMIRAQIQKMPEVARWAAQADAIAGGIRIDDGGNLAAGVRIAARREWTLAAPPAEADSADATPPILFQSGDFILSGAARLPGPLAVAAAGTYARQIAAELRDDIRVAIDDEVAARFQKAVEEATGQVSAAALLTRPGENQDGTYSNAFLAVRVGDAKLFVDQVTEVMRLWNEMNKSEEDESRLVFETEAAKLGGRDANVFTLDMVEAFGAAAIPEVRPSMERMFGPGGKLRLLAVPVDTHIVLLAAATDEQATPVIDVLEKSRPPTWDERTNRLLPHDADWRLMVSPQGHTRWLKRQMDAMLGPVIGAPLVRQFPASPPVGAAGGFTVHEIWTYVAIPSETIRAAGQYLHQR